MASTNEASHEATAAAAVDLIHTIINNDGMETISESMVQLHPHTKENQLIATLRDLSAEDHSTLFVRISEFIRSRQQLLRFDDDDDEEEAERTISDCDYESAVNELLAVADMVSQYLPLRDIRPESLLETVSLLHECLIPLDDEILGVAKLKQVIARICEAWWTQEEAGAENAITQLIPYLLLVALASTSKDIDIRRLYNIRKALLLLDFQDESIESIQNMLLRCVANPSFLKVDEGRRFIAFLYSIDEGTWASCVMRSYL